jgi:hypothetical protein
MDPISTGAKGAVSTLKNAQNAGKDLGKIVVDQQADIEATVNEQHRIRVEAKLKENAIKAAAEFKAFERYERDKAHQKELQHLKEKAIAKYGKNAWVEIESLKNKLEKERIDEDKLISNDRDKINQLFWWCATVAALITYFLKLYK